MGVPAANDYIEHIARQHVRLRIDLLLLLFLICFSETLSVLFIFCKNLLPSKTLTIFFVKSFVESSSEHKQNGKVG